MSKHHRKYSEDEMLQGLRDAAAGQGTPLTVGRYDLYRAEHPEAASYIWIIRAFGSWVEACQRAGVPVNKTRSNSRKWSHDEVLAFVATYLASPDSRGTYDGYATWAKATEGAPSAPTLRTYFPKWAEARELAAELLEAGDA